MKAFAACLLLVLPTIARADVLVEFWGFVDYVIDGSARRGDPVSGSMRINQELAPTDRHPGPNTGNYIWNDPGCDGSPHNPCQPRVPAPSGFVSDGSTLEGDSDDHVWFEDSSPGGAWDAFGLENTERGAVDRVFRRLEMSAPIDFTHGGSIDQSFDVDLDASGGSGWLTVNDAVAGVKSFFGAALSRLRVSLETAPGGSCHAT